MGRRDHIPEISLTKPSASARRSKGRRYLYLLGCRSGQSKPRISFPSGVQARNVSVAGLKKMHASPEIALSGNAVGGRTMETAPMGTPSIETLRERSLKALVG